MVGALDLFMGDGDALLFVQFADQRGGVRRGATRSCVPLMIRPEAGQGARKLRIRPDFLADVVVR